ncbi:hypothetical protein R6Q59_036721 [Mikania micrantha]|uniref:F-box domain-containing protein n=1 Tax=Mikania micrantha TaxID=192012 RepID=A0A5N6NAQ3_9ASTR|nr:hypothetical protein E3N88_22014 [Mikania micrantha]
MSDHLSEDVIVEIFSRLPVKPLLRFRSVSKSLRDRIGSPNFIRLHTLRSPKKLTIIHRARCKEESCNKLIYTLHDSEDHLFCNPYIRVTPVEYPFKSIRIVGSCNGVLCVYESRIGINLWNPSIRRKVTVPDPPSSDRLIHGFGFDPIIQDYKILRISDAGSSVYTLKTRSWHEIASPTRRFPDVSSCQCLFNGALHWVVKLTDSYDVCHYRYIMTFDLSSEAFSTIGLPEPSWETSVVTIIKDCLAVISSKCGKSKIWVKKEYDNTNTNTAWCVAYRFNTDPFKGAMRVFQRSIDGYLVFNNFKGIMISNPESRFLRDLRKLRRSSFIVEMNTCEESLELLGLGTSCDHHNEPISESQKKQNK